MQTEKGSGEMEITQLHYFKTVAKYESFTQAAEELHITQSALSRSIAQLENDIGIQLFERRKGGCITLNRDGHFFLQHVIQVLNTLENTVSAVKEMAGLETGVVNVSLSEFIFIKHIVLQFLKDFPNVRLSCFLQSNEQARASLDNGTLNFAICKEPIAGPELVWTPLFRDRMCAILPPNHRFSDRESLHLAELKDEHFIISNLGYDMATSFVEMCNRAGFEPYIVYEGNGEDLCGRLVAQGIGVMIAPYSINQGVRLMGVDKIAVPNIPLADDFAESEIGIVHRKGQFQSEAAKELRRRVEEFYTSLPPFVLP